MGLATDSPPLLAVQRAHNGRGGLPQVSRSARPFEGPRQAPSIIFAVVKRGGPVFAPRFPCLKQTPSALTHKKIGGIVPASCRGSLPPPRPAAAAPYPVSASFETLDYYSFDFATRLADGQGVPPVHTRLKRAIPHCLRLLAKNAKPPIQAAPDRAMGKFDFIPRGAR